MGADCCGWGTEGTANGWGCGGCVSTAPQGAPQLKQKRPVAGLVAPQRAQGAAFTSPLGPKSKFGAAGRGRGAMLLGCGGGVAVGVEAGTTRLPQSRQKRSPGGLSRPHRSQRTVGSDPLPVIVTGHLLVSPSRQRLAHFEHELEADEVGQPEAKVLVGSGLASAVDEVPQHKCAVHGGAAYHGRLRDLKL